MGFPQLVFRESFFLSSPEEISGIPPLHPQKRKSARIPVSGVRAEKNVPRLLKCLKIILEALRNRLHFPGSR